MSPSSTANRFIFVELMKRVLKLVALVVSILFVCQPLLACPSCIQLGEGCASVCCTAMSGMSNLSSMQLRTGGQTLLQAAPGESGCGQTDASFVSLPQSPETLAQLFQSKGCGTAYSMFAALHPVQLCTDRTVRMSDDTVHVTTSKQILFQIFRI